MCFAKILIILGEGMKNEVDLEPSVLLDNIFNYEHDATNYSSVYLSLLSSSPAMYVDIEIP